MANKRMIILLYIDPIGYADSPPLSIPYQDALDSIVHPPGNERSTTEPDIQR